MDWRWAVPYLQLAHALFGGALLLAFLYQGWVGLRIRRRRRAGTPDLTAVRRHRRLGPVLSRLLPLAFLAGLVTAYLDRAAWVVFPAHLAAGAALVAGAAATEFFSRRIRGPQSPWRLPHLLLGATLIALFVVQAILGLGVLL